MNVDAANVFAVLARIAAPMNRRHRSVGRIANGDLVRAAAALRFSTGLQSVADPLFWRCASVMTAIITFFRHCSLLYASLTLEGVAPGIRARIAGIDAAVRAT